MCAIATTISWHRFQKIDQSCQIGGSFCAAVKMSWSAVSALRVASVPVGCKVVSSAADSSSWLTSANTASNWFTSERVHLTSNQRQPTNNRVNTAQIQLMPHS